MQQRTEPHSLNRVYRRPFSPQGRRFMWVDQRGSALLYVITLGTLLSIGLGAARLQYHAALNRNAANRARTVAEFLAEAGQDDARARLQDKYYDLKFMSSWEHEVPDLGTYTVSITRPDPAKHEVVVRSEGTGFGSSPQTFTISRTYGFRPGRRYIVPFLTDSDISLSFTDFYKMPDDVGIRSNGDIHLWWNDLSDSSQIIAAGDVYDRKLFDFIGEKALCTLPQCHQNAPRLDLHMPSMETVTKDAYEIVLTDENTIAKIFYFGGTSQKTFRPTWAGFAQDTTEDNPLDFRTGPNNIHIRSGDGRTYYVRLGELIYAGVGTISFSPDIKVLFGFDWFKDEPLIRRAKSARSQSCLALLPFSSERIRLDFASFEGILVADKIKLSNWSLEVAGAVVAQSATFDQTGTSHIMSLKVKTDPELLINTPPQVPQGVETYLISENRS